jgi:endonuclease-3|tara:strand:+ start:1797 stop:2462 length:666 start_codon:yes stop_codon:yes gene_type:complete
MAKKIKNIDKIISLLKKEVQPFETPVGTEIGEKTKDPFQVLVSCLLSLRTKDTITGPISRKLFLIAKTPKQIDDMSLKKLQNIVRPVNYYITKSKRIKQISRDLVKNYNSKVPSNFEELMEFKGVGRKTANIVMVYGHFSKDHIPVDIHVHRFPNRMGWIKTKKPEETEEQLKNILPKRHWQAFNDIIVTHGQNVCVPITPFCSRCFIKKYCMRIGVEKSR